MRNWEFDDIYKNGFEYYRVQVSVYEPKKEKPGIY